MNRALKIFLGIFFTFLVLVLSSGFEMSINSIFDFIPMGVGSQISIIFFSIILIYIFSKRGIIEFHFGKVKFHQLILPIGLTVLVIIILQLFSLLLGDDVHQVAELMSILQQLIYIVVLASLSEELLFRGFLQNMLNPIKSFGINLLNIRLSLPVIISGILFGLIHFALIASGASFNFVIQIVISAMFIGMIAGYFQEKFNNFIFAYLVHMTANLSGILVSMIL